MANFQQDTRIERFLDSFGVSYEWSEDIPFTSLMSGWNEFNLGRPTSDKRVTEAIESYAEQAMSGSPYPGVIVHRHATRKGLEVLDGCQRLMGAQEILEYSIFGGYIVKCHARTAGRIRGAANIRLGGAAPVDLDAAVRQYVELFMINDSLSAKDVASDLGVTQMRVKRAYHDMLAVARYDQACQETGFVPKKRPRQAVLRSVHEATHADDWIGPQNIEVLKFLEDLTDGRFTNGDSQPLIAQVFDVRRRKGQNVKTQLASKRAALFKDNPEFAARVRGRRVATPVEKICRSMKQLQTQVRAADKDHVHIDPGMAQDLDAQWRTIGRLLRKMVSQKSRRTGVFEV